jgi:cathepsin L
VVADASNWAFYKSGVFSSCETSINHVVVIVGWREQYWTVMNNWGRTWGEDGMIRLAPGNTCGICEIGVQPIVRA